MTEQTAGRRVPPPAGLIAGGLVVLGLLLSTFVAWGFLVLAGLGAFGPGILRELGWLRDQDEFQRQAAHRAGYHAYLVGGLATVLVVAALRAGDADIEGPAEWLMLILLVLWTTWLFSALLAYWGGRKTASRVLIVFGSFWAVFVIASVIGEPAEDRPLGVLMAFVFAAPFFVLAYTAGRWPRATGALLLAVAAFFLVLVAPMWVARAMPGAAILVTATLLFVPLIASGIALLREESVHDPERDESDDDGAPVAVAG